MRLLIGLTGGIGSGKSTIARRLRDHGAVVIDADDIAREVVEPGKPALAEIISAFGPQILNTDGTLNRSALAEIVFNDSAKRQMLNDIVHPAVRARTNELFEQCGDNDVIIYDVPLLVESNGMYDFDHIIVASAPEPVRVQRLMENRGMTEAEAQSRIESQASEESRLSIADTVINTGSSLENTYLQVDEFWKSLATLD